jgi:hypothetical protein
MVMIYPYNCTLQLGDYGEFMALNDIYLATALATLSTAKMRVLRAPVIMHAPGGDCRYAINAEIYVLHGCAAPGGWHSLSPV